MISSVPVDTARAAYRQGLDESLAAAGRIAALPQLPTRLMALNATFYLDSYLPTPLHRAALNDALSAAAVERQDWLTLPAGAPSGSAALRRLVYAGTPRPALYRWLFDQAVASGRPLRLLLAQHACEMAEVLDQRALFPSLRFGLLALPAAARAQPVPVAELPAAATLIEGASRALLCGRLPSAQFIEHLLVLHAANRARELIDPSYTAPLALAAHALLPLLTDATMQHVPKRLRVAQPCELAHRALPLVAGLAPGLGALAIEAGLVEGERLSSAQHLLLLAALDRVLTS